jgi:valyl-tRNA synthetase
VERTSAAFEEFEYSKALEETEAFFWSHLTDNYLELVKRRARSEEDPEGRASALAGLRLGLSVLLRLLAPILPTITEEVWSWAFAGETGHRSIHQSPWPGAADFEGIPAPGNAGSFALAAEAIAAIRRARTEASLGMGRPLKLCRLRASAADLEALAEVRADVLAAANAPVLETSAEERAAEAPRFAAEIEAAPAD